MKTRCFNKASKEYKNYGAKGVTVCDRWAKSFEAFLEDMGRSPSPDHSIDRYPNNRGNYEPGNCRWATQKEQCRNKTNNRLLILNGRSATLAEWAEKTGIPYDTIYSRLRLGWSDEKALTTPVKGR